MAETKERPKPFLLPQFCKGCGRCIQACKKNCIHIGSDIHPETGLRPVVLDLEHCSSCGLCMSACPEPYGLAPMPEDGYELDDPARLFGERVSPAPRPRAIPDHIIDLPKMKPVILKGTYASAIGAILAGCRHFFGYPITPSTEGAELMAKLLPQLDGVFLQAVSEVATANHMYGCGGAGLRCMTFTSSPGFSLMMEAISYMIGAEVPGLFVNIMRGGPGLGNIGPSQSDVKLACHGLGHGDTHAIVLAPTSPQEMLDITMLAFDLSFKYRNPVVILGDGYLGQMTGKVHLPGKMIKPGIPEWAVYGDEMHRGNLINSIMIYEPDMEKHNIHLLKKFREMSQNEQRADTFYCDDAEIVVIACNTPSRMAKGAVKKLREGGVKAGLFRPITIWPFPIDALKKLLGHVKKLLIVEASSSQLENEVRLALSYAGITPPEIHQLQHYGGVLTQMEEIVERLKELA